MSIAPILQLDDRCGDTFTFRDLIEDSDTFRRMCADGMPIDNAPHSPDTVEAMRALARDVLDPVARALGRPTITYGFAGAALVKRITQGIAPELDQHAGWERTRSGKLVCPRGGLAVDFTVPGVGAAELADFVWRRLAFDRMYLYGPDRPIHVSVGLTPVGQVTYMRRFRDRRVPQRLRAVEDLATIFGPQ